QEGATQRVQEMLNALEGRLGVAESAYPALVFYQLRRLWQTGRKMVAAFVADLARQQDERERRAHLAQHNREQFARRQELVGGLRVAASGADRTVRLASGRVLWRGRAAGRPVGGGAAGGGGERGGGGTRAGAEGTGPGPPGVFRGLSLQPKGTAHAAPPILA